VRTAPTVAICEAAADDAADDGSAEGKSVCDTGHTVVYATIVLVCTTSEARDAGQCKTFDRQDVIV
jgi:hypothetical protein